MSHSFKQLPWDGRFVGIMHATPPKQLPWDGRLEGIMHSVLLLCFLLQRPMQTVGADGWLCLESCEVRLWREVLHQEEWLKEDSSEEFFFLYLLPFPLVLPDMIKMVGLWFGGLWGESEKNDWREDMGFIWFFSPLVLWLVVEHPNVTIQWDNSSIKI